MGKLDKFELIRKNRLAANKASFDQLTEEQQKAVRAVQVALRSFVSDFSESFDVSTVTARDLQECFWDMNRAFETEEESK
jgi:hypothetical protein